MPCQCEFVSGVQLRVLLYRAACLSMPPVRAVELAGVVTPASWRALNRGGSGRAEGRPASTSTARRAAPMRRHSAA